MMPAGTTTASSMSSLAVRTAHAPPTHPGVETISHGRSPRVSFRHPGYADDTNILFVLLAADHPDGGIHHETARLACAIVAGNRWDGYLAASIDGPPVDVAPDAVLPVRDYYFCVPGVKTYPVVPAFRVWKFPHNSLPDIWAAACPPAEPTGIAASAASSALSVVLRARDRSCRMSACEEACEVAHVCPRAEDSWFHANGMQRYNHQLRQTGSAAIDDMGNALLLRADLHHSFDMKKFVFVPKRPAPDAPPSLLVHVLDPLSLELRRVYHNVPLQELQAVNIQTLFARFAYSVFSLIDGFLQYRVDRELLVPSDDGSLVAKRFKGEECHLMTRPPAPPKSRRSSSSSSPRKRARTPIPEEKTYATQDDPAAKRPRLAGTDADSFASLPSLSSGGKASSEPHDSVSETHNSLPETEQVCLAPLKPGPSDADEEQSRLGRLRDEYLAEERKRSDPGNRWTLDEEWARNARSRPLSPRSMARLLDHLGADVVD